VEKINQMHAAFKELINSSFENVGVFEANLSRRDPSKIKWEFFEHIYALSTQAAGAARDHRLPNLPDTCPEATAAADATSDASGSGMFDATPVTRVPARISFEVAS
jgi:hypothetical protein